MSDLPLMALALLMIPTLLLPEIFRLTPEQQTLMETADWFIYACFAADFVIKLYLAPSIKQHLRRNWLDVILLALPFLRPLRVLQSARLLRLLGLARMAVYLAESIRKMNNLLKKRGLNLALVGMLVIVVGSAGVMSIVERGAGGSIKEFRDALWWAAATVTTVGYGDAVPVTVEGRAIAIFLMVVGIAFFGVVTANVAAFFVEADTAKAEEEINGKLDVIIARLDKIERRLDDRDKYFQQEKGE